jgi:multiple RNA-binding domain-containing protein 1
MQHPLKTQTWANGDAITEPPAPLDLNDGIGHSGRELLQIQGKKQKTGHIEGSSTSGKIHSQNLPGDQAGAGTVPHNLSSRLVEEQSSRKEAIVEQPSNALDEKDIPTSDADWLRSKTSRLLGLLGDEELEGHDTISHNRVAESTTPAITTAIDDPDLGEAPSGASELKNPNPIDKSPVEQLDTSVDLIRHSGRLFIRNLPYDATENDLEPVFTPFGKIEEVSVLCSIYPTFLEPIPASLVMIILIGTSDAKHMM